MKRALLILALLCVNAQAADRIARSGANELRISDATCVNATVLAQIKDEYRQRFRAASAYIGGKRFAACWTELDGQALVVFDDADHGVYPLAAFRDVPMI